MESSKYDQLLREFLDEQHGQKLRGVTLEALHAKTDKLGTAVMRIATHRLQDKSALERYGRRLKQVENQVALISGRPDVNVPDWHPDPKEVTGTHEFFDAQRALKGQLEALEDDLEQRRDSSQWWRRKRREWGVAILGFVAATLLMSMVGALGWFLSRALGK